MAAPADLARLRNFGIIAHIDAGKTTLTERILYYTGKEHKIGEVHDGNAVMDWMIQEQERGITIQSAATTCYWQEHCLNIIDTPGHVDFTMEVERSLRVLDGAIGVFCAVGGVEPQSETVWRQASYYRVPRMAFINKLDRMGADVEHCLKGLREKLGAKTLLLQLPYGLEADFTGVIDLVKMQLLTWNDADLGETVTYGPIPEAELAKARAARAELLEQLAEVDDEFLQLYLEDEEKVAEETIHNALRRVTLQAKATPVFLGAAFRNRGVQPVLEGIVRYLPSPLDKPPVAGIHPETGEALTRVPKDSEPFAALAFKVVSDQHIDRLIYLRVYSGTVKTGKTVLNARRNRKARINRVFRMHANKREELKELSTGDIVAVAGLDKTTTGDTLCSREAPISLESMTFPEPVISVAIEPKSQQQRERLAAALERLAFEDPTFRVRQDEDTDQTIISGMGELHLEIITDRLLREFRIEANVGRPQVAYQETLTVAGEQEWTFSKQIGDRGHFARVKILAEPASEKGFTWINQASPEAVPAAYAAAVEEGVRGALGGGTLAGYPVTDITVTLLGGEVHPTDSQESDFAIAGAQALRQALLQGSPCLLEPLMAVSVVLPDEFLGAVIGSLNSRRGTIREVQEHARIKVVKAETPLAEMFGYATELRSLTQGRASYTMEFASFTRVPDQLRKTLLAF